MSATPIPFDSDAPDGAARPIIRYKPDEPGKKEIVNAVWGTNPRFAGGIEQRFLRAEGQSFASQRCLVPASEFHMRVGDKRFRARRDDGNFFYLAAIWEPAMAGWPLAFKIITVPANDEVFQYQKRQGAMIQRSQVMLWLDAAVPESDILVTPPAHSFDIEEIGRRRRSVQQSLAL